MAGSCFFLLRELNRDVWCHKLWRVHRCRVSVSWEAGSTSRGLNCVYPLLGLQFPCYLICKSTEKFRLGRNRLLCKVKTPDDNLPGTAPAAAPSSPGRGFDFCPINKLLGQTHKFCSVASPELPCVQWVKGEKMKKHDIVTMAVNKATLMIYL